MTHLHVDVTGSKPLGPGRHYPGDLTVNGLQLNTAQARALSKFLMEHGMTRKAEIIATAALISLSTQPTVVSSASMSAGNALKIEQHVQAGRKARKMLKSIRDRKLAARVARRVEA